MESMYLYPSVKQVRQWRQEIEAKRNLKRGEFNNHLNNDCYQQKPIAPKGTIKARE